MDIMGKDSKVLSTSKGVLICDKQSCEELKEELGCLAVYEFSEKVMQ